MTTTWRDGMAPDRREIRRQAAAVATMPATICGVGRVPVDFFMVPDEMRGGWTRVSLAASGR